MSEILSILLPNDMSAIKIFDLEPRSTRNAFSALHGEVMPFLTGPNQNIDRRAPSAYSRLRMFNVSNADSSEKLASLGAVYYHFLFS